MRQAQQVVRLRHRGRRLDQYGVADVGGRELRRVPEFDDCLRLAREADVPVRDVLAAASGLPPDGD